MKRMLALKCFSRLMVATVVATGAMILSPAVTPGTGAYAQGPASVADLAEGLMPAVVNISTAQKVKKLDRENLPIPRVPEGSPFEEFFKDLFPEGKPGENGNNNRGPRTRQSLGSGFVVDADGIIITNNHVIADADEITVNFYDGSKLDAELVGADPKTDIAVLRVKPEGKLTAVPFGNSEAARIGDWVMAIGNPFGLGSSVSVGIVSAVGRDISSGPYDNYIQTDAAINKGNSGGPLFNMQGEVIGINTAIISPSGGSIGIGFSVPSNLANRVVAQLVEYGETRRGWLGVQIQTVTEEIAESLGLAKASGALGQRAGERRTGGKERSVAWRYHSHIRWQGSGRDARSCRSLLQKPLSTRKWTSWCCAREEEQTVNCQAWSTGRWRKTNCRRLRVTRKVSPSREVENLSGSKARRNYRFEIREDAQLDDDMLRACLSKKWKRVALQKTKAFALVRSSFRLVRSRSRRWTKQQSRLRN